MCLSCPAFGVCTEQAWPHPVGPQDAALRRHRAWMSTEEAKRAYRQRKLLVEPVFGIIKEQLQARSFLLRGLNNVAAEWSPATAFNLRTLWRIWRTQAPDPVHKRSATPNRPPKHVPDRTQLTNGAGFPTCVTRVINAATGVSNPPAHTDAETP